MSALLLANSLSVAGAVRLLATAFDQNTANQADRTVTFAVPPKPGNLIVVFWRIGSGQQPPDTVPSGFVEVLNALETNNGSRLYLYTKTAGAGETGVYPFTASSTSALMRLDAYRFSHGRVGETRSNAASAESVNAGVTGISPVSGSALLAAINLPSARDVAFSNGFTRLHSGSVSLNSAIRSYPAGGVDQNSLITWSSAANASTLLIEVRP